MRSDDAEFMRMSRAREQHVKLSADTSRYYDSLSSQEMEEQNAWGEFGESELAAGEEKSAAD